MGFNPFGCCGGSGGSGEGVSIEQLNELLKLKVNYTDTLLIKAISSEDYEALSDEEKNAMVYLISDLDETDDNNLSNLLLRIKNLEEQIKNLESIALTKDEVNTCFDE